MFGGTAKQAQRATLIAKIDSLAADIAKMASTHTEVLPLCSQARRPKVMTSSLHDSRHCTPLQSMATMHASLSALQAAEEKRAAAQTEADTISFLRQHVAELTEELEVGFLSLSAPAPPSLGQGVCQKRNWNTQGASGIESCLPRDPIHSNSFHLRRRCCRRMRPSTTPRRLLSTRVPPYVSNSSKAWYLA